MRFLAGFLLGIIIATIYWMCAFYYAIKQGKYVKAEEE